MIEHPNSERQLTAQDRLADRGIGLDFSAPKEISMANRELENTSQMGANMLVQIYKENPQIRAALKDKIEEISMDDMPLPGQIAFGVNPSSGERFASPSKKLESEISYSR